MINGTEVTKIGIVGSRRRDGFMDRRRVYLLIDQLKKENPNLLLVSGGCRKGADLFTEEAGRTFNVPILVFPIDTSEPILDKWDFTKRAYTRNRKIVENSSEVYCFVSKDRSGGTENTIKHAIELGKKIYIVDDEGRCFLSIDGSFPTCEPSRLL